MLAQDYVATVAEGKTALVVSPTHREGEWITDEIRSQLKRAGRLSGGEHRMMTLQNANLTEAERSDGLNFAPGDVLEFHQNAKGHRKGERLVVGDALPPLSEAARFTAYRPDILPVAAGDILRITRNGTTADAGHRLNNGATFTVKDFDAKGNIVLTNGWKIASDFGHIAYGYVVTSHASQGRTVDHVIIGESAQSLPAASREQFYVSVSRGRQRATIYTDDKEALLEAVSRSDDRLSATEFVNGRERTLAFERLEQLQPAVPELQHVAQRERERPDYDR
jgi:ATP-dependent exoDNAse (exonuclease V) alpha subunit